MLEHQDTFLNVFTENLMAYALGRRIHYYDMPTVRAIVHRAALTREPLLLVRPGDRQQRRPSG